jgi:D-glycero-D-manno-heptose 1,7-bisphosphate phosphatase
MHARELFSSSSIPGTEAPRRALFVGRNGALLIGAHAAAPERVDRALFSDAALGLLFRATQAGWNLYLIGNEESVAHGRVPEASWQRFEAELMAHLASLGVPVKRNYACLDHPRGKGKHRRDSVFLFPNTGALYHAAQEDGIELAHSWIIAQRTSELAAGWRAGCRTAAVGASDDDRGDELAVEPDLRAGDLLHALSEILGSDVNVRR